MKKSKLQSKPWYAGTVTACIAVVLYVVLTRPGSVYEGIQRVIGYFVPLLIGCVIAYLVNPLARMFSRTVCKGIKNEKKKTNVSNILSFVFVFLIVYLLLMVSVPQLISSISDFAGNLGGYVEELEDMIRRGDVLAKIGIDSSTLISATEDIIETAGTYITDNLANILNATVGAGRNIMTFALGFILSIYLLGEKSGLKTGAQRFLKALLGEARYASFASFLQQCDLILNRYIVFNIIDSLIVGVLNAVFMLITGMPYVGLISFVVAITNLIPTFGPIIGAVVGGFLLVLVNPWNALAFLAFTLVLQICDGYILKPRLFGNSLGVSGLWIMVGVIIGGRMFGIGGILLAIPGVAILDYIYRDRLMPWLERRRAEKDREAAEENGEEGAGAALTEADPPSVP